MKTEKSLLFILLALPLQLYLVGCQQTTNSNQIIPTIDLTKNRPSEKVVLSEIAKEVQYIELESNSESFLGEVSDIILTMNYILILDRKLQTVLLFDSIGKYLRKIGKKGQGPGEFGTAFNIAIDDNENRIYIYSTGDKIIEYDIYGNFVRDISTRGVKMHFFRMVGDKILFTVAYPLTLTSGGYTFGLMDSNGKILKKKLYRKKFSSLDEHGM